METLTERQNDVLAFVHRHIQTKGYPPTIREIRDAFHLKSNRGVIDHLRALERKGWIRRNRGISRAIEIVQWQRRLGVIPEAHESTITYPVAGRIAAGRPAPAIEEADEKLILDESLFSEPGDFILEVKGDSMIGAHIVPGDLLVVKRVQICETGDMVVALVDGEATVKRYLKRAGTVVLQPANPRYEPLILSSGDTQRVEIIGRVVGVIRRISSRRRRS